MPCSTANVKGIMVIFLPADIPDREQDQTNERQGKEKDFYRQCVSICTVHNPPAVLQRG
jgi:hypothetical protein